MLGTAIRIIRKEKGLKQKELAAMCDLSLNGICQIELNRVHPHQTTVEIICCRLGVNYSYLLLTAMRDTDVSVENRKMFNHMRGIIKNLLN